MLEETSEILAGVEVSMKPNRAGGVNGAIILPSGLSEDSFVKIKDTAEELFRRIAPTKTMFMRGGRVVSIVDDVIEVIEPAAARSRLESYARMFLAYRAGKQGEEVLKPLVMPQQMALALLESEEARTLLPKITGLINCPVLVGTEIAGPGYHPETGLFITGGTTPPEIPSPDAVAKLKDLIAEFDFQSDGDRSRAIASFISPGLKFGGHLRGNVPVDVGEADDSQSGKTYRQRCVAAVYNETPSMVTCRTGGVGSVDESLNHKLIAGRPFIQLDNFRGKLDSPHLEALLTSERLFPVRLPYSREVVIDPTKFLVMLTSNGVETTRDFANRCAIVRIRKRKGYKFKRYPEGDLLDHVRANQPEYLGAVFAIVREWIAQGRQRTAETRHDFREWAQTVDWILQHILREPPLMDGHEDAQERVSNPDLTFLRNLALAVSAQCRLGEQLIASALYEIAEVNSVTIPGLREPDEERGKKVIGSIMARLFKSGSSVTVDEFTATRHETEILRHDGSGPYTSKSYKFERSPREPGEEG